MLYGMGAKSLGEQLGVVEEDAAAFISDFKSTYPEIKTFIDNTLIKCRQLGFVETMNGRRRYLPKISATKQPAVLAAAERQAVNTTVQGTYRSTHDEFLDVFVLAPASKKLHWSRCQHLFCWFQGSAADLVKKAMNDIDCRIWDAFPHCRKPLRPSRDDGGRGDRVSRGAYFLLQLHDELLYEVMYNLLPFSKLWLIALPLLAISEKRWLTRTLFKWLSL